MTNLKIEKDKKTEAELKLDVMCGNCKRSTKHQILSDIKVDGCDDCGGGLTFLWTDELQIIQCLGCERISFRLAATDENRWDWDEHWDVYLYPPNPAEGRTEIADSYLLPTELKRIYTETLTALNTGLPVLAGIGIRAIVETVGKDKNAKGKNLEDKINDLVTQGALTQDGADILHKLRTLGNKAAHEVKPHDNVQLGLAFDVVDHLLQGVYILPYHSKEKFK